MCCDAKNDDIMRFEEIKNVLIRSIRSHVEFLKKSWRKQIIDTVYYSREDPIIDQIEVSKFWNDDWQEGIVPIYKSPLKTKNKIKKYTYFRNSAIILNLIDKCQNANYFHVQKD